MTTKERFSSETLEQLKALLRLNVDATDGFTEAAQHIEDKSIANMFMELAKQRKNNVVELHNYVEGHGEDAALEGSFTAALHRAWLQVRSLVSGGDRYAILSEAERGEDAIKGAYEDAMREITDGNILALLKRQYSTVKAGHDQVKSMRDKFANN